MKILPIIQQLRTAMPVWFQNVDAGATWEYILDKSRLQLPAFYIMLGPTPVTRYHPQPPEVDIQEQFSIIAVLKNTQDQTGKYAQDQVEDLRAALIGAIMGWVNQPESTCLIFDGDDPVTIDKARYIHQFKFRQETRIDWTAGVQPSVDSFNTMYNDWNLVEASEETRPQAQDHIENIYPLNP